MSESASNRSKSQDPDNSQAKNLYRSSVNRMVGGVAGGIGEYFAIDPTLVRLGFILLTLANGVGVLLYAVMWIIMPESGGAQQNPTDQMKANADEIRNTVTHHAQRLQSDEAKGWWGWLLVAIGLFFIVQIYDLFAVFDVMRLWPLLLIGVGVAILVRGKS